MKKINQWLKTDWRSVDASILMVANYGQHSLTIVDESRFWTPPALRSPLWSYARRNHFVVICLAWTLAIRISVDRLWNNKPSPLKPIATSTRHRNNQHSSIAKCICFWSTVVTKRHRNFGTRDLMLVLFERWYTTSYSVLSSLIQYPAPLRQSTKFYFRPAVVRQTSHKDRSHNAWKGHVSTFRTQFFQHYYTTNVEQHLTLSSQYGRTSD